jgi:hypothetical protein
MFSGDIDPLFREVDPAASVFCVSSPKTIERLSADLRAEFEDMKGFSARNLRYMRAIAKAYPDFTDLQPAVAKLPEANNTEGNTALLQSLVAMYQHPIVWS